MDLMFINYFDVLLQTHFTYFDHEFFNCFRIIWPWIFENTLPFGWTKRRWIMEHADIGCLFAIGNNNSTCISHQSHSFLPCLLISGLGLPQKENKHCRLLYSWRFMSSSEFLSELKLCMYWTQGRWLFILENWNINRREWAFAHQLIFPATKQMHIWNTSLWVVEVIFACIESREDDCLL